MPLVLLIIIIAILVGGTGLLVEGLELLLIIALVLLLLGAFTGYRNRL